MSFGVFAATLLYEEAMHPTGTSPIDSAVAFIIFLAACWKGRWTFSTRPSPERAIIGTAVVTAIVILLLGTYTYVVRETDLPDAYIGSRDEVILPRNVVGAILLSLPRIRKLADATAQSSSG